MHTTLSTQPFSSLNIEDMDDYLSHSVTRDNAGNITDETWKLGFDSILFTGSRESGSDLFIFRMDVETCSFDSGLDFDTYKEKWDKEHPDRLRRVLTGVAYNNSEYYGYIVLSVDPNAGFDSVNAVPAMVPTQIPAAQPETVRQEFTFGRDVDEPADQLRQINEWLAAHPFSSLDIEDMEDYLSHSVTRDKAGNITDESWNLGFDSIVFVGEKDSSQDLSIFRLDTEIFPIDSAADMDTYGAEWDASHPDRQRSILIHIENRNMERIIFVVLSHD